MSPSATGRTYAELVIRAGQLLARGESVVLDAWFTRHAAEVLAADVAAHAHSVLVPIRCEADAQVSAARLRQRAPGALDADGYTCTRMAARADEWPEAAVVRTDRIPDDSLGQALARVGGVPSGQLITAPWRCVLAAVRIRPP